MPNSQTRPSSGSASPAGSEVGTPPSSRQRQSHPIIETANGRSLEEINATVSVPNSTSSFWKNLAAFSGPGALVAVGYMDPGNWITSIGGGAQYGYLLMSVILISSLIAMSWP